MMPKQNSLAGKLKRGLFAGLLISGVLFPQACGCNDQPSAEADSGVVASDAGETPAQDSGPAPMDAGDVIPDAGPAEDAGPQEDGGVIPDAGPMIPPVTGVGITNADVRACDLLFVASQAEVPAITFNAAVRGRYVVGAPQVAATFVALSDQSLEGVEILEFVYERQPGAVTLVKADCFDSSGNAVASPGVSINP
jgi:hypothetical protein